MSIVDEQSLAREVAGNRAREEARTIDRLVETMRLASFRAYLVATVRSTTAIVPDLLVIAGTDVGSALQRIRPSHRWPATTSSLKTFNRRQPARLSRGPHLAPAFANPCAASYLPPLLVGDAIISEGAPGDWIAASIVGDSLEIVLRSDGYELSTHAGVAHLKLAGLLPDPVVAACVGRPLVEVVDHPLLRSGQFVIERAAQVVGSTRLSFDVGQVGIELPWRPESCHLASCYEAMDWTSCFHGAA